MAQIFRKSTLVSGVKKKKNEKNRKRNTIINFRVSPEEKELIEKRIELTGLHKADFFIDSCLHQHITAYGNIKTFEAIKKQIDIIDTHLQKVTMADELDMDILESLRTILEMLDGLNKEESDNG